jgi:acyl-CoA reductase-like NAD-dependent aldehyde dehydrogenase
MSTASPATGAVFARCPAAGKAQLEHAISVARRAGIGWSSKPIEERAAHIKRMAAVLRENQDSLAELLTREQGKPLAQSRDEIGRAGTQSEGMAAIPIPVETLVDNTERRIELHYRPLGVVGIITPWNAPINLAIGPLVSALYTGNTVILKPSPYTPLCTLKLGELLRDVFPAGVINILAGGDEFGQWMTEAHGIDKISFTGSVATGKKVMTSAPDPTDGTRYHRQGSVTSDSQPESQGHCISANVCWRPIAQL